MLLIILGLVFLVIMPLSYVQAIYVKASGIRSINPSLESVGSVVNIIGVIDTLGGEYSIWFNIDNDEYLFENGERVKSGLTNANSYLVNDSFIIPSSTGSYYGIPHIVVLRDDRTNSFSTINFSVRTSVSLFASPRVHVGTLFPIDVIISGGNPLSSYYCEIRVVIPDGTMFRSDFTQNPDAIGEILHTLYYVDSFPNAIYQIGDYSISAVVIENIEGPSWDTGIQVQSTENQIPTATIESITPKVSSYAQPITFTGYGYDSDGTIVGYNWSSSQDGQIGTSSTFIQSNLSIGTHTIYFAVQDNDLLWSTLDTTTIEIIKSENLMPIAEIILISPNPAVSGQEITFSGKGADSDGLIVNYEWRSDIDGFLSSENYFSVNSLSVGYHIISFQVCDDNNLWSDLVFYRLEVISFSVPVAYIDSIEPNPVPRNHQVAFIGHGESSDSQIVSYRWTSSIDQELGDYPEFSLSSLSLGTHTISFQVQDSNGVWSDEVTTILIVEEEIPLIWFLPPVGGIAAITSGVAWLYFSKPPPSFQIKNDLQQAKLEESKRIEKEKRKHKKRKEIACLELLINAPSKIMSQNSYEAKLKIKNLGPSKAQAITVNVVASPGISIEKQFDNIDTLEANDEHELIFPFVATPKIRKGVYSLRFKVRSKKTLQQIRNWSMRAVKIALLSTSDKQQYAQSFREWLKGKSYSYEELTNADNLTRNLLKYDLIILVPELEMPQQWLDNLFSFVENSQALLVTEKIITSDNLSLAKLLGYEQMRYRYIKSTDCLLKIIETHPSITHGFSLGDGFEIKHLCGDVCTSKPSTGKSIIEYHIKDEPNIDLIISALIINEIDQGKTVHLNFHAEKSLSQLSILLEKTIDWLLS